MMYWIPITFVIRREDVGAPPTELVMILLVVVPDRIAGRLRGWINGWVHFRKRRSLS